MRHLLKAQLPDLPGHLRAVLALWVEGTRLALNGCQDTVTLALAHRPRGSTNPHTLRRLQRELLYDDADRIESWGQGQELEVARCFAPLLRWVRRWWVPTGGRELAQEPRVLAVDPTSKQDDLVALVISGVYRQHAVPWPGTSWGPRPRSPGLTTSAACCGGWPRPCRLRCRCMCSVTRACDSRRLVGPDCGLRLASVLVLCAARCTFQPEGQAHRVRGPHAHLGTRRAVGGPRAGFP